ncbi:cardiolipin synthase [Rubrivirga sp. S365]|uniref:Cardiolipin synthase n=1 Tax=Rubrivirga litoralis TaxID=3075598 RepID=A0ABU3BUW3_9BACT|nr:MULTISPECIES: cardiolipin synthase [unclassified Rubrivirga]MDT0633067.1 cardiolipin synthase [Rubrivirga sp. F394]MDT7857134.1 cardiolipin synthase [Rubrivirga sp. S365]
MFDDPMTTADMIGWAFGFLLPLVQVLGVLSAVDAIMHARTPQGSAAWVVALVLLPLVTLPLYWAFGRSRFEGYVRAVRQFDDEVTARLERAQRSLERWEVPPEAACDERTASELRGFANLSRLPFLRGNSLRLLVDGKDTFDAILGAIDAAEHTVVAQFYIVHDDRLGRRFQRSLLDAAARGVHVFFVYDGVGSHSLPRRYVRTLREAGVEVNEFSGERGWLGRFRINFRNHRKIVVVDGQRAFVGGLNVGDEYLGLDPTLSPWRDTHLAVEGPAAQALQLTFARDWYYGRGEVPELPWELAGSDRDQNALVVASGPADRVETAGLLYAQAIAAAEHRVWIASPYFVPDGLVLGALQSAALRGVDVRVIMPRMVDSWMFRFVPYAFLPDVEHVGVKVFLYEDGFMHQKVILVDDDYAAVGTANFDNRSFRLNFEVTCLAHDAAFCADVEAMLEADLARSTRLTEEDLTAQSFPFRLAARSTRLLAPVL